MMDAEVIETSDLEELEELQVSWPGARYEKGGSKELCRRDDGSPPLKRVKLCQESTTASLSPLSAAVHATYTPVSNLEPQASLTTPIPPPFKLSNPSTELPTLPRNTPKGSEKLPNSRSQTPVLDSSQDPLLLNSPSSLFSATSTSSPTRRSKSPPFSAEHDHNLAHTYGQLIVYEAGMQRSFTPPPPFLAPSSPPTPPPPRQLSNVQPFLAQHTHLTNKELHPNTHSQSTLNGANTGHQLPRSPSPDSSRYPLRRRQAVQIAPYSVDKYQYKQALKHNPDAFVRVASPGRSRHGPLDHYEDDEASTEAQQVGIVTTRGADNQLRRKSRTPVAEPEELPTNYPEILQDLPSTDDDVSEELRALSKEARSILRERKAKERKQRRTKGKTSKNIQPFPDINAVEYTREDEKESTSFGPQRGSMPSPSSTIGASPPMSMSDHYDDAQWTSHEVEQNIEPEVTDVPEVGSFGGSQQSQSDGSDSASHSGTVVLDKKRLKALNRMMPKFMVRHHLEKMSQYPKQRRQRSETIPSDDENDQSILPGQTRVRKVNSKHTQEIRGDSESSDHSKPSPPTRRMSSSDVEIEYSPIFTHTRQRNSLEVINLSETENDTSEDTNGSSAEDISDEGIKAYLDDDVEISQEESLIDWMLTRTRTIGAKPKTPQTTRGKKAKKYPLDIVTHAGRKYGNQKQTILSFDKHTSLRSRPGDHGFRPVPPKDKGHAIPKGKQQRRTRRPHTRQSTKDVYIFHDKGNRRILSGFNQRPSALSHTNGRDSEGSSPLHDWANVFLRSDSQDPNDIQSIDRNKAASTHVAAKAERHISTADRRAKSFDLIHSEEDLRRWNAEVDMDIHVLPPGTSFSQDTFIGKGWLHELVNVVATKIPAPEPGPCHLHGYKLRSDMGFDEFLKTLGDICNHILEFSTGLPEVDQAEQLSEWDAITRVVCQLLSWYYGISNDEQRQKLRRTVEVHVETITQRLHELELGAKSLDIPTLQLDWFVVELSFRVGCEVAAGLVAAAPNILRKALLLLMEHLIELNVHSAVGDAARSHVLDSSTIAQRGAELWVRLIYLLGSCSSEVDDPKRGTISFWSLVLLSLQSRETKSTQARTMVWRLIFSLCALSQFSIHGMTTSQPRLPAAWPIVTSTLKKIRLTLDPAVDRTLPIAYLDQRDRYIKILLFRCFHLCDEWRWQLDNASDLFNELGEVFRSRKFTNLRHERPDYPFFMLHNDWSLLSQYEQEDSAFVVFLKLIVKAIKSGQGAMTAKSKKLLSLATPVGSLPFTKATPPSIKELPMLFNRLGAVAVGIYLDPASHKTRISHARTYVAFANADDTTRAAVVRGMMNLATLMRKINVPLDATAEWIAEISSILSDELKSSPVPVHEGGSHASNQERHTQYAAWCRLHIFIQMLLGSVRCILDLQRQLKEYPEPALILSTKYLLHNIHVGHEPKTAHEIRRLTETLLDARSAALPPPERPPTTDNLNAESQDEYSSGFDFDFNDPSLIAALTVDERALSHRANEEQLHNAVKETNLFWFSWRNLTKFIQESSDKKLTAVRLELLDRWIYCWLGCSDILVRNDSGKSWSVILELRDGAWKITDDAFRRRVNIGIATRLLKLYPMLYSTHADMFLEAFFESLAEHEPTIEHGYVSSLLSIDRLQHPLFRGLTCLKQFEQGNFEISSIEFATLRIDILKAVFINLNLALDRERGPVVAESEIDNQRFIGYCIKCFSAMRSIFFSLKEQSPARELYLIWCKQVFSSLRSLRVDDVLSQPRLAYWLSWGRSLEMIS